LQTEADAKGLITWDVMAPAPAEGGDGHGTGAVPITRVQRAFRPDSRVADLGYLTQRHKVVTLAEGRRTALSAMECSFRKLRRQIVPGGAGGRHVCVSTCLK
jgi:hypothetical protein